MTSIINKILGRDDESHSHSTSHNTESSTTRTHAHGNTDAAAQNTETRTVQHEGVNIKSTVSSDVQSTVSLANQQKLKDLVTKLGQSALSLSSSCFLSYVVLSSRFHTYSNR